MLIKYSKKILNTKLKYFTDIHLYHFDINHRQQIKSKELKKKPTQQNYDKSVQFIFFLFLLVYIDLIFIYTCLFLYSLYPTFIYLFMVMNMYDYVN